MLQARSFDNGEQPAFEVTKGPKKVALVTFDWKSDRLDAGSIERNGSGDGLHTLTITLTDPRGTKIQVTLSELDGKVSSSGDLDRVKIETF